MVRRPNCGANERSAASCEGSSAAMSAARPRSCSEVPGTAASGTAPAIRIGQRLAALASLVVGVKLLLVLERANPRDVMGFDALAFGEGAQLLRGGAERRDRSWCSGQPLRPPAILGRTLVFASAPFIPRAPARIADVPLDALTGGMKVESALGLGGAMDGLSSVAAASVGIVDLQLAARTRDLADRLRRDLLHVLRHRTLELRRRRGLRP